MEKELSEEEKALAVEQAEDAITQCMTGNFVDDPRNFQDATPTWEGVLPILLETIHLESSRIELRNMARCADNYNTFIAHTEKLANRKKEDDQKN